MTALDQLSLEARRSKQSDGTWNTATSPDSYSIFGEQIQFDSAADEDVTLRLAGAFKPAYLGPANKTNWLTKNYPHILRPACLAMAADFLNDDTKYNRYVSRVSGLLKTAQQSDDMSIMGMQVDVYPSGSTA